MAAAGPAADADRPSFFDLIEALVTMDDLTADDVNTFEGTVPSEVDHYIEREAVVFDAPKYLGGPQTIGWDRFTTDELEALYERYFTALVAKNNPMLAIISYRLINVYNGDLGTLAATTNPMLVAWLFTEWATASEGEFLDWYSAYVSTDDLNFAILVEDFRADSTLAKYVNHITQCERAHLGGKVIDPQLWIGLRYRVCLAGALDPRDYFTEEEIAIGQQFIFPEYDENNDSDDEDGAPPEDVPVEDVPAEDVAGPVPHAEEAGDDESE